MSFLQRELYNPSSPKIYEIVERKKLRSIFNVFIFDKSFNILT